MKKTRISVCAAVAVVSMLAAEASAGGYSAGYGSYGSYGGSSGGYGYGYSSYGSSGGSYGSGGLLSGLRSRLHARHAGYGSSGGSYGYAARVAYGSSGGYGYSYGGSSGGYASYVGYGSRGGYGSSGGSYGGHVGPLKRLVAKIRAHKAARRAYGSSGGYRSYASYGSSGGYRSYASYGSSGGSTGYVAPVSYAAPTGYGSSGGSTGGYTVGSAPIISQPMSSPIYETPMVSPSTPMEYGTPSTPGDSFTPAPNGDDAIEAPSGDIPGGESVQRRFNPELDVDAALLTVAVPNETAEVTVNGHQTTSEGIVRQFMSRGLKPGYVYNYEVQVAYLDGGERHVETRDVTLRPGDSQRLLFDEVPATVASDEADPATETTVTLRVPEDAEVFLAGRPAAGSGTVRTFRTGQLRGDDAWRNYEIRVTASVEGQLVSQRRTVDVTAGETIDLTFDFDAENVASK